MTSRSSITTDLLPIVTPGEILLHEFLRPMGIAANALAIELRVPGTRIHGILKGKREITADTALRLSQYFGNTPQFWLNLQRNYDLELAKRSKLAEIQTTIRRRPPIREPYAPAAQRKATVLPRRHR